MAAPKLSKLQIAAIIMIFIIFGAAAGAYYFYTSGEDDEPAYVPTIVKNGDNVKVDYTGHLSSIDGPVFETTLKSIADNPTVEKSPMFDADRTFEPVSIYAGGSTPNVGLAKQIIGHPVDPNSTFWVNVYVEEGYKASHGELVVNIPVDQEIPLYQTLPRAMFTSTFAFQDKDVVYNNVGTHPFWGWGIKITKENAEEVEFENSGARLLVGQTAGKFPWKTTVTSISQDTIYLKHDTSTLKGTTVESSDMKPYDPELYQRLSDDWGRLAVPGTLGKGVIRTSDEGISIDFNLETAGKELWYEVTILQVMGF